MPEYAVPPADYAHTYIPYDEFGNTVMTLIVRGNQARVLFRSSTGKIVGTFAFELPNYQVVLSGPANGTSLFCL